MIFTNVSKKSSHENALYVSISSYIHQDHSDEDTDEGTSFEIEGKVITYFSSIWNTIVFSGPGMLYLTLESGDLLQVFTLLVFIGSDHLGARQYNNNIIVDVQTDQANK